MYQAILPFTAVAIFGIIVFRWTTEDMQQQGHLSPGAASATAILVMMHALMVLIAAGGGALVIDIAEPVRIAVGAVIGVFGFALTIAAISALGSWAVIFGRRTGPLVTSGIYARMRHPLYVGWPLTLLGVSIAGGSVLALLLTAVLAAALYAMRRGEAERMRAEFGADYANWSPGRRQGVPAEAPTPS